MAGIKSKKSPNAKFKWDKIAIPRDNALKICLLIQLYVYFIGFFTYNFGIPETAYYLTDILLVICLFMAIKRIGRVFLHNRLKIFTFLLFLLIFIGTESAWFNGFHIQLWMWSLRNWGRFFLYFYLCCELLDKRWIERMLSMTINVFLINVVVIAFQYFIVGGFHQDTLNGLVGRNTSGANTILIMASAIIVTAEYVRKRCSLKKVIIVFGGVLIVSALAELKAVILFAALIFMLILLANSKFTKKEIVRFLVLAVLMILAAIFGLKILAKIYPEFAKILSIKGLIGAVTSENGYGNTGYIDRLTAINVINRYIFKAGETAKRLFGIGMGNAEYSAIKSLTSSFFNLYGASFRYLGFCVAMLYIECGYFGLGLYIALFAALIITTWRHICRNKIIPKLRILCFYESIGLGMSFLGLIYIWYNNLLRTDMAVLMAFYMAIPFALTRKGGKTIVEV